MIGIFDSGSGGLTVLRAIKDSLPSADILYFGDIKNAPYGSKPREELTALTVASIELLQKRGVKNIVSACNSVSASLALSLLDAFDIAPTQLIEMVGPTVAYFKNSSARILLCATPATITSAIYQNAFRMVGKDIETLALEKLAGAIEAGAPPEEVKGIIEKAFDTIPKNSYDILVLGCTHYPLVKNIFEQVVGHDVLVFDPAVAVAERVEKLFWPAEAGSGTMKFLLSKDSQVFKNFLAKLFPNVRYELEVLE
jgi:glutamate racemase